MKLPRVRFTIKLLMVAVAFVALLIVTGQWALHRYWSIGTQHTYPVVEPALACCLHDHWVMHVQWSLAGPLAHLGKPFRLIRCPVGRNPHHPIHQKTLPNARGK